MAIVATAALSAGLAFSGVASAQTTETEQKVEIVQRGPDGRAQVVKIGEMEYQVCVGERQDDCINPAAAGLKWGDRPLKYWPGKPASEIDEPLPAERP